MLPDRWKSKFVIKQIPITLDQQVRNNYDLNRLITNNNFNVDLRLFDIIVYAGEINTALPPHHKKKDAFHSKRHLLGHINRNSSIINLNNPPNHPLDEDQKQELSKDFGVGIGIMVLRKILDIDLSTVTRINWETYRQLTGTNIRGVGRRPDIYCIDKAGENLIIAELKGTTNKSYRSQQLTRAISQKATINANINIAIGTYITLSSRNDISNVKVIDPPSDYEGDIETDRAILRSLHYSRAFNFIKQYEIAKYFYLMSKRIKKGTDFPEYNDKMKLFRKLTTKYHRILIDGNECIGTLDKPKNGKSVFMFRGVLEKLIYVDGIFSFQGIENNKPIYDKDKYVNLYPDGICFGIFDSEKSFEKMEIKEKPYWEN